MDWIGQLELQRVAEQMRFDGAKSIPERNRRGQFATPPTLARDIARYAFSLWKDRADDVRFLDPAVGTGAFYSAVRHIFPRNRIARATGMDIDARLIRIADRIWGPTGLRAVHGDFTTAEPPPAPESRFNLILANPPYVRHHHLDQQQKQRLRQQVERELGLRVSGLAGLYCYFLLLCHKWLADDGIALWLVPSEFLAVNYGQALRRYLTEHVSLLQLHQFQPADVQFSDALVSSTVIAFNRHGAGRIAQPVCSFGGPLRKPETMRRVDLSELRATAKWTHLATARNTCRVGGNQPAFEPCTLGELFEIKRGLATGANRFFVLKREEARRRAIPDAFLRPILPSPRYLEGTVIEGDPEGFPSLPEQEPLVLLDCDLPEALVRRDFPALWEYLQLGKRQGIHQRYLPSRRNPWYSQEKRNPSAFLCTYMGRAAAAKTPFRFLWNRSRAVVANVYLQLEPRPALKAALQANPQLCAALFRQLQETTAQSFLAEGRVYGGGLYKLEPRELQRVPVKLRDTLADLK